jgi:hypothetical protein
MTAIRFLAPLVLLTIVLPDAQGQPPVRNPGETDQRRDDANRPGGPPAPFLPFVPPILATLDSNANGELTADELAGATAALWKLDKNDDGQLTSDEFMPVPRGFGGPGGPGPMRQERLKVLERFDNNGDGILLGQERADARKYVRENAPQRGFPGPGGPPGGGPPAGPGFGPPGFGPPGFGPPGFGPLGFGGPGAGGPGFGDSGFGPPDGGFEQPGGAGVGAGPGFGPPPPFGAPGDDAGFDGFWFGPPGDGAGLPDEIFGGFGGAWADGAGPFPGGPPGAPPFGGGPPGGRAGEPAQPGKRLAVSDVASYPGRDLYDPAVLRTIFLEFENQDWEEELEDFRMTDVDVPARMTVDGDVFENVGVRFRGNTSYMMTPRGSKRPLNVTVDYGPSGRPLYGCRTLNLLNAQSDPSFLRSVLYSRISRSFLPALDANLVRLVVNGENWGIYVNEEQFNKDFVRKWFGDADGARWKAPVNFSGSSGLMYLGEDEQAYRTNYEIKSADNPQDWKRLIELCRALHETPMEQRKAVFDALMNVDEILWFLAVDNALIDGDGYFSRASDYSIYLDRRYQRFYLISHDNNETFRSPEGPGAFGSGRNRAEFDPLSQIEDGNRPLVTALLTHPPWRARYLAHVRTIAEKWLDWNTLGPVYEQYRELIDTDVRDDTKKRTSYDQFRESEVASGGEGRGPFGAPPGIRTFVEQRRAYLLNYPAIAQPRPKIESVVHRLVADDASAAAGLRHVEVEARMVSEPTPQEVLVYHADRPNAPFQQVAMRDDGQAPDRQAADGIYTVALPPQVGDCELRYYVEARGDESLGTTSFLPEETEQGAFRVRLLAPRAERPPVVINEFMATNTRTLQDPQGEYDDWLELYNRADTDVDLSGMYLSDSAANLRKWRFPEGTVLPARNRLIVWLDEADPMAEGLHATFKLSRKGETIYLLDTDIRGNVILDQITFGPLKEEISFGRSRDGGERWQPLLPTPGASNRIYE